ncbi:MAG: methyltransferase domain-containing protein [Anaerolineae bacterium]|nr:methyltransferase domain-containing protein [Anaerolineae bacterium]
MPRICDYEGSRYRTDFWEGQNRAYEDQIERVALQKLLPPKGQRLIEIGAGFGRLADLYQGYQQVILTDYARTQLEEAQTYLGTDSRFIYVVSDIYNMPFVDNLFETLTMVRVMHHLADVPAALSELHRLLAPNGMAVIEYASKFHLKALLRWLLGRQEWSPFDPLPYEFVELNFNFHPTWMRQQFEEAGFRLKNVRSVSHYRINLLKRLLPTSLLVKLDSWAQPTGNWWQLTPSIFVQAQAHKPPIQTMPNFFRCPICHSAHLVHTKPNPVLNTEEILICQQCQGHWSFRNGIYDFKTPLNEISPKI